MPMLCSYSIEDEKINVFSLFLENAISGNSSYQEEVKKVIKEVKELCLGNKSIYTIDRNNFTIIQHLFYSDNEYFKNIDLEKINESDYKIIESKLRVKNEFAFA